MSERAVLLAVVLALVGAGAERRTGRALGRLRSTVPPQPLPVRDEDARPVLVGLAQCGVGTGLGPWVHRLACLLGRRFAARFPGHERRLAHGQRTVAAELLRLTGEDVAAGADPAQALADAARSLALADRVEGALVESSDLAVIRRGLAAGLDPSVVLAGTADRLLRSLGICWAVTSACGAPLAPVVERLGSMSRADAATRRAAATALAGPRSTIAVLAALPLLGLVLGASIGAHPVRFLFGGPPGLVCLGAGLAFEGAGLAWTRRIIAAADPERRSHETTRRSQGGDG